MLFSRPFILESTLKVGVARARMGMRSADALDLAAFRERQRIGWRLSKLDESFVFQPEYGERFDVAGARLVALVEPTQTGSRIRGRIVLSLMTRIVLSLWILSAAAAMLVALDVAAPMFAAAILVARYRLRSTERQVQSQLRHALEEKDSRVAA